MSFEWPVVDIADVCSVGDGAHSKVQRMDRGVLYLTSKNIGQGTLKLDKVDYISEESFSKLFPVNSKATRRPEAGDVLLGIIGTFGNAYIYKESDSFGFSSSIGILRPDKSILNSGYLYYVISSPKFKVLHASSDGGSVQGYTNIPTIKKLPLPLPPLVVQESIANLLRSLDDRITLLRETNATLEAITQALFKSWFVDFDPVRAKAEGLEPQAMDATTAALFPDSFEESELGLVPKGWRVGSVGDLAEQKKGSVNPLATPNEWFEHFSLPAFDNAQAPVIEQGETIKSNKTPLPENAVLLSKLNPHIPRVWLPVKYGNKAVCSTEFLAYSPKGSSSKELIYCLFSAPIFQQQLCQLVTGTSNSHQRVKPDQVLLAKLVIASDQLLRAFSDAMKPLFERVYANRQQAQTLAHLRDTLLPRLISGQLRLPDAEQAVEEALA